MKSAEILLIVLVFLTVASFSFLGGAADGFLDVYFFDVGQGDAIFVETADGKQILIDGGPNDSVIQKLGEVMGFNDRSIDILIVTHTDNDHITGLVEVLKRYDIGLIMRSNILCDSSLCLALEEEIENEGTGVWVVNTGDKVDLGYETFLEVLYPLDDGLYDGKPNNNSIVAKISVGRDVLLLTGDIEKKIENILSYSGIDVSAKYLKIAHHGSKSSTTEEFLNLVSPSFAFIEVGRNNYGHPNQEVLQRLENRGITYYRTDRDGDVHLIMGRDTTIKTNSL